MNYLVLKWKKASQELRTHWFIYELNKNISSNILQCWNENNPLSEDAEDPETAEMVDKVFRSEIDWIATLTAIGNISER